MPQNELLDRGKTGSVYRHMDKKWVDQFFETGELLLTTLPKCREHDVLNRADSRDGKLNFALADRQQMMAGISVVGARSYILCASHSAHAEVQSRFGTDSWIEIVDAHAFASAIAETLACTRPPKLSSCIYVDQKEVTREADYPLAHDLREMTEMCMSGDFSQVESIFHRTNERLASRTAVFEDDAYFRKTAEPYRVEQEFRFVWFVDQDVSSPTVVRCEKARQWCRRAMR